MKKKFLHYFVPVFLVLYFSLAFFPVLARQKTEIFPFFSFKLYSKIPNGFSNYDILYNKGESDEHFLLHNNSSLNKLERKNYASRLRMLAEQTEPTQETVLPNCEDLLARGNTAFLVELSGDYVTTVRDNEYNVEIISQLK